MIHLDHVSFGYTRHKQLFKNLSLRLEPGHIYGLLGKNGAGKSSLLRLMAGLLFPQKGTIKVAGLEPRHRKPSFWQGVFFFRKKFFCLRFLFRNIWKPWHLSIQILTDSSFWMV